MTKTNYKTLCGKLALALIDMLEQHTSSDSSLKLNDDGLSSNENAISTLWELGVIKDNKIDFNKLNELTK